MIKILGLGTGRIDALTVKAYKLLKESNNIYIRTGEYPTAKALKNEGIEFGTYDEKYNTSDFFKTLYDFIAEDIIAKELEYGNVVYAVPGHPLVAEKSVTNLIEKCKKRNIEYEIFPATSFIDLAMEKLEIDASEGFKVIDAFDIRDKVLNKRDDIFVTQVYNGLIASEVKLKLLEVFDDETIINYIKLDMETGEFINREIPLFELDWQEDLDHTTYIFVKKDKENKYDIYDLIEIIDTLRAPNGCPWDSVQTHDSIKRDLLEECYEVIDAIESEDMIGLEEELGDLMLHVVFHSSLAKEEGDFTINDVIARICKKMIYRHPHVFKDVKLETASEVIESWDDTKKKEKGFDNITDEMNAVAKALPSLIRAVKIQKKASKVGFDFESVEVAMEKVNEELNEIKDVYKLDKVSRIEEEVGDLLFSAVNVGRMLSVDCEEALEKTVSKFVNRFSFIESTAASKGKDLKKMSLEEMDGLWDEIKKQKN
ncbi:MAG: nucleoside triphosphate pyrophosphohydrolase [Sarcina sp.]